MRDRVWIRRVIASGAVALALAAAVLIPMVADAYPFEHRVIMADAAKQDAQTDGSAGGGGTVEPDPVDDDSVIVECVALAAVLNANQLQSISNMSLATVPRNPLGPLKCWPNGTGRIQ